MPECALPEEWKKRKHNDWPFFLRWVPRSWNAFGPRCPEGSKGHKRWPPQLVKGRGIARWEAVFKTYHSIVIIPEFINTTIGPDVYNKTWDAIETHQGAPNFGKRVRVKLFKGYGEGLYSPSALQRFSKKGWMKLDPWYVAQWFLIKQKGKELGMGPEEDYFAFNRQGYRPDHNGKYYNWGPMLGLKMD